MCGIAGFYSLQNNRDQAARLKIGAAMEQAIAHRGPDAADIWHAPDAPLVLAHRRLAVIDLSDDGRQPMHSSTGRYVIAYNGEIYNYLDLQKELVAAGHQFKSRSDTEVMLTAFEHWGVNQALQKINGMFAIVLWDQKEKQLHFMRDRFGKKPLYIGWVGSDLVFASELKSFHAHPDFTPSINRDVLALYMRYGYVHAPYAIFDKVWQLLPAARLTLDVGDLSVGSNLAEKMEVYWSLKDVAAEGLTHPITGSEDQIIDDFEGLFEKAVAQRMISDVPFGAFLSGGLDSSSVVALMQKQSPRPVKTFSIGFNEDGYDEAQHAKKIAAHLGTDHQEFYVSAEDALDIIPKLPEIYDEPFSDSSQIPTYLISKLARSQVTVALTGDGGDEILGGYDRHTKIPPLWSKVGWMPHVARQVLCGGAAALPENFYGALKSDQPLFGGQVKRALELMTRKNPSDIYDALVESWPAGQNIVKGGTVPPVPLKDPAYWPQGLDFAQMMLFGDHLSYRPNDVMVKADRASMANALELRAPLMDYKLAAYCWRLPHDMKVRGGQGKWLLRQVLKRYVPENLTERPKMGFSVPLGVWLRGPLKEWGDDLLDHERLEKQGFFDAALLSAAWQDFQHNQTFQTVPKHLWSALMFQAWLARWSK